MVKHNISIMDYMSDTTYLKQVIEFLNKSYGVIASVLDSEGNIVVIDDESGNSLDLNNPALFKQFYAFEFTEDIGGIMCTAKNKESIAGAEDYMQTAMAGINTLLQRELEIQQMSSEIMDLSEQINFLFQLAKKMIGIRKLQDFCEMVVVEIAKKIGADSGFISVKDAKNENITSVYNLSNEDAVRMQKEEVFNIASQRLDTILSTVGNEMSVLVSPLDVKDGVIGFMAFFRDRNKRFFTAYEKKFVSIIDNSISSTVETLRLYDNLKELYLNTVKALAAAIDAKDPYTHGHSFRVAKYSMAIAKKLNFSDDQISEIEVAGYMHDIGKIGVLDAILRKAGKLTDNEYSEMKKHPGITWRILEPIHLPENIILAAAQHHERLDGSGYPFGLSGDEIHPFAKIIAVADVFDALTSERVYRPAMPIEKALTILCEGKGKEFDSEVVMALVEAFKDGLIIQLFKDIYRDLNYSDLQKLNQFLVTITGQLIDSVSGSADARVSG
jgi:HD-GYP domain-containing protein (c-di-GMP phosphodiesterase class II)